jgi:hypothetical protein
MRAVSIESTGAYTAAELFREAIRVLQEKCRVVVTELNKAMEQTKSVAAAGPASAVAAAKPKGKGKTKSPAAAAATAPDVEMGASPTLPAAGVGKKSTKKGKAKGGDEATPMDT